MRTIARAFVIFHRPYNGYGANFECIEHALEVYNLIRKAQANATVDYGPYGGFHEKGTLRVVDAGLDSNTGGGHWNPVEHWRVRISPGKHARKGDAALHGP